MKPTAFVADFDSAAAMLRGLSNYLHGWDFPLLGAQPRWTAPVMKLLAGALNRMPDSAKEQVYIWGGRFEAIAPRKLRQARAERIAEWVVGLYPRRKYLAWPSDRPSLPTPEDILISVPLPCSLKMGNTARAP